jgi:hypothetical protein
VNRQNNFTDDHPSVQVGGRSRFGDDKHTLLHAGGSNSGIRRYITLSVNSLQQRSETVYTHQIISLARDGLSWRKSSETTYRPFPTCLNVLSRSGLGCHTYIGAVDLLYCFNWPVYLITDLVSIVVQSSTSLHYESKPKG